ncbi:hypothetical protein L1987_58205 [Smallanthus sonchifolius]|uniref:Uncharacterized protein n=1 Tax=Smallanthus sonchifolius TaxID=185202 RepID=A0ACB9DEL6_9ASTR|nr:hypothetical protein L1987_58205 [Smallanthus sonchifolius]
MDSNHSSYSYTSMNQSIDETYISTTEESGWTSYFEDFMVAQQQDHHHNHSLTQDQHYNQDHYFNQDHYHHQPQQQEQQHDRPELSDAASHVEWNNIANSRSGVGPKFTKKLNLFKKKSRRTREVLYDDSLEDTASSPVNSPKVGSQHMGFNQVKVDDIMENSLEKGDGFDDHLQLQKIEDQSRPIMRFEENNNGDTDLRKRGLCLVPLSMFVNYI